MASTAAVTAAALHDDLAAALLAAELGERVDPPLHAIDQLFASIPQLRASVPYATLCLLAQLARHKRIDVRINVACAVPWFGDLYPERAEAVLAPLLDDLSAKVRQAAVEALADLLEVVPDLTASTERWRRRARSGRAQEALANAQRRLSVKE